MATKDFHPQDFVFILYDEDGNETGRMYPVTEEDYFECMEQAMEIGGFECRLKSENL